jgi:molybdopterin-guanine dinucleotide biosynthesis protein A
MNENAATLGVILAGGRAQRLGGGDKPLRRIGGRTMLERVIERFSPQCERVILNGNGDATRFASFGLPVVADNVEGFAGPLSGILAALDWAALHRPARAWVVSAPGDCPFLPSDLVARLHAARASGDFELSVASSGGRAHPTIGLWRVALRDDLRYALTAEKCRKVSEWSGRYKLGVAAWSDRPLDPFFNVNTPADLAEAERLSLHARER